MADPRIIELRQHLRRKFPAAHSRSAGFQPVSSESQPVSSESTTSPRPLPPLPCHETPTPATARPDDPGFDLRSCPPGAITEIVPSGPASGLSLVVAALLDDPPPSPTPDLPSPPSSPPLVLVDARDRFDPDSFSSAQCGRLLWVRCRETTDAIEAADLLMRDGNLPLVLLDLSSLPARELRRIHRSTWHRLRQLAAGHHSCLVVLSATPTVPCAAMRLRLDSRLSLDHLDLSRREAISRLHPTPTRLRHAQ